MTIQTLPSARSAVVTIWSSSLPVDAGLARAAHSAACRELFPADRVEDVGNAFLLPGVPVGRYRRYPFACTGGW